MCEGRTAAPWMSVAAVLCGWVLHVLVIRLESVYSAFVCMCTCVSE